MNVVSMEKDCRTEWTLDEKTEKHFTFAVIFNDKNKVLQDSVYNKEA